MSISEHFRYRNDVFQSDIFVSDIRITDVDVGCWISPTLRSMLMPTYAFKYAYRPNEVPHFFAYKAVRSCVSAYVAKVEALFIDLRVGRVLIHDSHRTRILKVLHI
jgi:hypothetical protein